MKLSNGSQHGHWNRRKSVDKFMEIVGMPLIGALFVFSIWILATGEMI